MAQCLFFAKILLKDTGIIAVNIDDYEQAHLKIVLDMVFDENNYIGTVAVARSKNGKGSKKNNFATNHEYLHIYGKTSVAKLRGKPDEAENYDLADEHGRYRVDGLFRKKAMPAYEPNALICTTPSTTTNGEKYSQNQRKD